jgi:hypothetical protein
MIDTPDDAVILDRSVTAYRVALALEAQQLRAGGVS